MLIIDQNTTSDFTIPMKDYFSNFNARNSMVVEITIGKGNEQTRHLWYNANKSKSTMTYNSASDSFTMRLTQEETVKWKYQVPIQIRVKELDGTITRSDLFYAYINPSLSNEVL